MQAAGRADNAAHHAAVQRMYAWWFQQLALDWACHWAGSDRRGAQPVLSRLRNEGCVLCWCAVELRPPTLSSGFTLDDQAWLRHAGDLSAVSRCEQCGVRRCVQGNNKANKPQDKKAALKAPSDGVHTQICQGADSFSQLVGGSELHMAHNGSQHFQSALCAVAFANGTWCA